ncbi:MAG: hypothetical protein EBZ49_00125 [Proteobacteria bacterium]|nr:hypothetical protein [Pseudomonadota bacterium]
MYQYVSVEPTAVVHQMNAGAALDGALPGTNPSVSSGEMKWASLTHGGLFSFQGQPVIVESLSAQNSTVTWSIIDSDGNSLRAVPQTPFLLSANESLKATGNASSPSSKATARVIARLAGQKVL